MRHGLLGKKLETMKALLAEGLSVEDISKWLGVIPEFVQKFAKPKVLRPTQNKFEGLPVAMLKSGKGYNLKDLRDYVNNEYKADLPGNSSRAHTIEAFLNAKSKAAGA